MFKPQTPEQIRKIIESTVLRELRDRGDFMPDFFLAKAQDLINEAIEWQNANPDKSAWGDFRIDLKAKHLTQQLLNTDEGELYELTDENLDRIAALDEAIALYRDSGREVSDDELCAEFEFTPEELTALRAVKAYRDEQDAREVMQDWK